MTPHKALSRESTLTICLTGGFFTPKPSKRSGLSGRRS